MYETGFDRENFARKKPLFQGLYRSHSDPIGSERQLSMSLCHRFDTKRNPKGVRILLVFFIIY